MKKKYDLAVATEKYTNRNGEEKTKWQNIGSVMQNDKGFFALIDRTFNPAGVPNPENKSQILVSMFEPKQQTNQPQQMSNTEQGDPGIPDDDIPFN